MSLITRCPACETMFKVVPDQLRISEGWVRCGQCGEIFDAARHLLDGPDDGAAPVDPRAAVHPGNVMPGAQNTPAVKAEAAAPREPETHGPGRDDPQPRRTARHDQELVDDFVSQSAPGAPLWVATIAPEEKSPPAAPVLPRDDPPAVAPSPSLAVEPSEDGAPEVSFMRNGKKNTVWRRPVVRIVLLLLVLLLVAVLAAQVLIHERDRIVSVEPSARPILLALCAWSGCKLSPLRQIESIVIESSSFTSVRPDNYKLAFSLKNNAVLDLAMPAIELSLTDAQDQAVIRRVILPTEFGVTSSSPLAAGSGWSSALWLSVKSIASLDRITGYRLLVFYP